MNNIFLYLLLISTLLKTLTNTNDALHFLKRFALTIAALLESTVEQQEPPQKVHARGKDYMVNNSINLNTNLLTQTTLLTFSLASLLQ